MTADSDAQDVVDVRERLQWAASVVGRYGGPASQATGEPVFTHLPALTGALRWVSREGDLDDVRAALPVGDVLGAAWERLGELSTGTAYLDALLQAVERVGIDDDVDVARVLRRRARLAIRARHDARAETDLQRAYDLACLHDPVLTVSVVLDRVDLATARGDWEGADLLVPELLRRTESAGDPLLQAMALNRSGWVALGSGQDPLAAERYQRAWELAGLHEDPVVQARSAAGLALVACRQADLAAARVAWQQSLVLAEQLHDRGFVLHCLDGIALLLTLRGERADAVALVHAATATRATLSQPREVLMQVVADQVLAGAPAVSGPPLAYVEALACARGAVART